MLTSRTLLMSSFTRVCLNEIRNIYSCRERKDECFERKINPERISWVKDVSKILRGSLFLGHALLGPEQLSSFSL